MERLYICGAILLASLPTNPKTLGTRSVDAKSSISLFKIIPIPGVTIPVPKPKLTFS